MISKKQFLFFLLLLMTFSSCGNKPKVEVIKMAIGTVENTVTTINSGTVEAKAQAELAFGTMGRIAKTYVTLGSKVKKGDLIAELENADLKAVYDETQKELIRSEELFKNGLVSISNLDSAKRAREVALLSYQKTIIRAPFSGLITAMDLKPGEYYQSSTGISNKPTVQIIDLKKRIIKGDIDEVDLQKVTIGSLARIKIPALKNKIFQAKVTKVVPFVSVAKDQDRTSRIELEIIENLDNHNEDILIPVGASADVEIISEKKDAVKILPTNVFTGTGKTRYIYKVIGGKLSKQKIKLGLGNYERVEILEGLDANEIVARPLEGIEFTDGMKVEVVEKKWP